MQGLSRENADAVALFKGGSFHLISQSDAAGLPGGPKAFLSFCCFKRGADHTVRQWEWLLKEGYVQLADIAPMAAEFCSRARVRVSRGHEDYRHEMNVYSSWDFTCISAARAAKEDK